MLISRGVPLLLAGDEVRRTQGGNNNAYCQDNETSWLDWSHLERHQEIFRFARDMIAFRDAHPVLSKEQFYTEAEIRWLNAAGGVPDWFAQVAEGLGIGSVLHTSCETTRAKLSTFVPASE